MKQSKLDRAQVARLPPLTPWVAEPITPVSMSKVYVENKRISIYKVNTLTFPKYMNKAKGKKPLQWISKAYIGSTA